MKAIQVMFDTLNRNYLNAYETTDIITPNFDRLKNRSVRFDNFFAGSLPCMPARRDLQTGRYNFLHRSWGPMEPFDDSMPEILKSNGVYTHLVTDHKHYWRDGGATYHTRYSSYDLIRGQEGDNWKAKVDKQMEIEGLENLSEAVKKHKTSSISQDLVNREYMPTEEDHSLYRTVESGLEFLRDNKDADQWFLQIECFDPHEPFFVPKKYLEMYGIDEDEFNGWLLYSHNDFPTEKAETVKTYYKALLTMCDAYLGKVLDFMDENNMWDDTLLIVNTDHGLLLGEHEWWGKNIMPVYNEVAQLPFFIWNPQLGVKDESRSQLAQNIDVPATVLDFFNLDIPEFMKGKSLRAVIESESEIHQGALFGTFGSNINLVDGDYIYMRGPAPGREHNLHEYTLMPMRMNRRFTPDELKDAELDQSFAFTKGISTLKVNSTDFMGKMYQRFGHKLFNCKEDPKQEHAINDVEKEFKMILKLKELMYENEAPEALYKYYGLDTIESIDDLIEEHKEINQVHEVESENLVFSSSAVKDGYFSILSALKEDQLVSVLKDNLKEISQSEAITGSHLRQWTMENCDQDKQKYVLYQLNFSLRTY